MENEVTEGEERNALISNQVAQPKEIPIWRICMLMTIQIGINLLQNSLIVIVLPFEMEKFFPSKSALALGILVASGSAFTILNPIFGFLSDKSSSRWGKRR
jgi:Na+/melibiose symporter-like transporter